MKAILKRIAKEAAFVVVAMAIFSALFILLHLAVYQTWPRWK